MAQTRAGNSLATENETAAPPDVLYVVRQGANNEALRYSLRSLRNLPHGKVHIIGYCPPWVRNVYMVTTDQNDKGDQENSNTNLMLGMTDYLSETFVFMNDDFFIMQPTESIPVMHQGPLSEVIKRYRTGNRFHQAYSLITTKKQLESHGVKDLLSYELHMPMVMNKWSVQEMFDGWPLQLFAMRPRTLYGNKYKLKGEYINDAKEPSNPQNSRFISTSSNFTDSPAGSYVRSQFPDASAYES